MYRGAAKAGWREGRAPETREVLRSNQLPGRASGGCPLPVAGPDDRDPSGPWVAPASRLFREVPRGPEEIRFSSESNSGKLGHRDVAVLHRHAIREAAIRLEGPDSFHCRRARDGRQC